MYVKTNVAQNKSCIIILMCEKFCLLNLGFGLRNFMKSKFVMNMSIILIHVYFFVIWSFVLRDLIE